MDNSSNELPEMMKLFLYCWYVTILSSFLFHVKIYIYGCIRLFPAQKFKLSHENAK